MSNKKLYNDRYKKWVQPYTSKLGISGVGSNNGLYISNEIAGQANKIDTVIFSSHVGIIETPNLTDLAQTSYFFSVGAPIQSNSVVLVRIVNYSGTMPTDGIPYLIVGSIGSGSFKITVSNIHATAPFNGVLKIAFIIINHIDEF